MKGPEIGWGKVGVVAQISGAVVSVFLALLAWRTITLSNTVFESTRRPWLRTDLAIPGPVSCTLDVDSNSLSVVGLAWQTRVLNCGQGAAIQCRHYLRGSFSRSRLADRVKIDSFPCSMLAPGDSFVTTKQVPVFKMDADSVLYLHDITKYVGAETRQTYFQEQVFYVDVGSLVGMPGHRGISKTFTTGPEVGYFGCQRGRKVIWEPVR